MLYNELFNKILITEKIGVGMTLDESKLSKYALKALWSAV